MALREALAVGRTMGSPPNGAPGPFGLAEPDHVRRVLADAGFVDVDVEAIEEPLEFGTDADDAFAFVRTMGIVEGMTHDLDEADTARALDAVYPVLQVARDAGGRPHRLRRLAHHRPQAVGGPARPGTSQDRQNPLTGRSSSPTEALWGTGGEVSNT